MLCDSTVGTWSIQMVWYRIDGSYSAMWRNTDSAVPFRRFGLPHESSTMHSSGDFGDGPSPNAPMYVCSFCCDSGDSGDSFSAKEDKCDDSICVDESSAEL